MANPLRPPRPAPERQSRTATLERRSQRLRELLIRVEATNPFYAKKLADSGIDCNTIRIPDDIASLPITTKQELAADQAGAPPWGTALTEPVINYTRYHQTSSTTGPPLRWLDTAESWQWMVDCWKTVYRAAHVTPDDRIFFPFGFGPFLGFWSAFDAGSQLGAMCIPGGNMSSETRLRLLDTIRPTVVCCTPTYALRLAEVTRTTGGNLADGPVHTVIVAGEPGGSIPGTRTQIETAWGARVIDHHGLTEVGPVSFECRESSGGLHLNEHEFICEVLDPTSTTPVADGEPGELVVTNLGRSASPVIRYRTRDIVRLDRRPCACGRPLARAEGGILSRADDMVCIRGVNVYPTAVEAVIRRFPEVVEYRSVVSTRGTLHSVSVDIELQPGAPTDGIATKVSQALRDSMGLGMPVHVVEANTLPRFEMKARRFLVDTDPAQEG
ncbi:MAG: AMP-binding protein [Acidobacteriota bacterium]|nr:AMP-binding protein [Acidobacteriota bacterium]